MAHNGVVKIELDHIQISVDSSQLDAVSDFYVTFFGAVVLARPASLATRPGCWLQMGDLALHLGVDDRERPLSRAHVAMRVSRLADIREALLAAGHEVIDDDRLAGVARCYLRDPAGNRWELIAR
jgi:catechol 2,3-dioxygenase-like lactoylglutathione lyase family enzyme